MNPENHWVDKFYLKFLYLGFILFLHFQCLECWYNEYPEKQANSLLIIGVARETSIFLSELLLFLER